MTTEPPKVATHLIAMVLEIRVASRTGRISHLPAAGKILPRRSRSFASSNVAISRPEQQYRILRRRTVFLSPTSAFCDSQRLLFFFLKPEDEPSGCLAQFMSATSISLQQRHRKSTTRDPNPGSFPFMAFDVVNQLPPVLFIPNPNNFAIRCPYAPRKPLANAMGRDSLDPADHRLNVIARPFEGNVYVLPTH